MSLLIHIDPSVHMLALDACTCRLCIADYYALVSEATDAASNAEGVDVLVVYSDTVNHGRAAEVAGIVMDLVSERMYRRECGRTARIRGVKGYH